MPSLPRLARGARNRAARALAYDKSPYSRSSTFYPQQPSCQIPGLAFIFSRFLGERETGVYVEIGANDGLFCSNTWGLSEHRWRGLLVEPVPDLALKCKQNYAQKSSVTVINCAIAEPNTREIELHLAGTLTTANTSSLREYRSLAWAARFVTDNVVTVPAVTLDALLADQTVSPDFDLLVVDVEGFESEVFSGFSLDLWRPKMIILELLDAHPDLSSTRAADGLLLETVCDAGYRIVYKDLINTVFVRNDVYRAQLA